MAHTPELAFINPNSAETYSPQGSDLKFDSDGSHLAVGTDIGKLVQHAMAPDIVLFLAQGKVG
jgi:hypothetical protein